jgi:hypothetical protein
MDGAVNGQRRVTEWAIWRTVAPGVSPITVIR